MELVQTQHVRGSVPQDCYACPFQMPDSRSTLSPILLTNQWAINCDSPILRFDNFLEQLTKLKKALYLLLS